MGCKIVRLLSGRLTLASQLRDRSRGRADSLSGKFNRQMYDVSRETIALRLQPNAGGQLCPEHVVPEADTTNARSI